MNGRMKKGGGHDSEGADYRPTFVSVPSDDVLVCDQ